MLKLLGFFEELGYTGVLVNGSLLMQVQPVGEPDEARIVEYLDVGHRITAVMEAGVDVLTGSVHRHTSGCSSLVTDGEWMWRADFAHYLETYHVPLPAAFTARVRGLCHQMPDLDSADFAPRCNETLLNLGWGSVGPWDAAQEVLRPRPRAVLTRAESVARARQEQPTGPWGRSPRKPRRPKG